MVWLCRLTYKNCIQTSHHSTEFPSYPRSSRLRRTGASEVTTEQTAPPSLAALRTDSRTGCQDKGKFSNGQVGSLLLCQMKWEETTFNVSAIRQLWMEVREKPEVLRCTHNLQTAKHNSPLASEQRSAPPTRGNSRQRRKEAEVTSKGEGHCVQDPPPKNRQIEKFRRITKVAELVHQENQAN